MLEVNRYLVLPGSPRIDLSTHDPDSKDGFDGEKAEGKVALRELNSSLSALQTRLWAESRQRLLVVLQAMDTGGKDGTIRSVFKGVNPQGVRVVGFGRPTDAELAHDYLWRIHPNVPGNGEIAIFNRSHYEDVLVVRVRKLVPEERWRRRYEQINEFERMLSDEGTTIVKLYLHISEDEQRDRLQARLDEPDKRWKFNEGDLEDRVLWEDFQEAYAEAVARTSTEHAPWFIVPANRKWYRNLVVATILIQTLEKMAPRFPDPDPALEGMVVS